MKENLKVAESELARDRRNIHLMSHQTASVEKKLFEAESKIRSLVEENENLLNNTSAPWIDRHKQYQNELKTKDLLHRRQEFYENKIAQLSLELNQLAHQSKDSHGSVQENQVLLQKYTMTGWRRQCQKLIRSVCKLAKWSLDLVI